MNTHEVIKHSEQRDGGFQAFHLLAEGIREPRKSPRRHSHAPIHSLNVTCADVFLCGVSADDNWYRVQNLCGRIPVRGLSLRAAIELDKLRVVNAPAKVFFDGIQVGLESIGCHLEVVERADSLAQVAHKRKGVYGIALSNVRGKNQFGLAVQRDKRVLVSPFFRVVRAAIPFFGVNEAPKLIGLDEAGFEVANQFVRDSLALVANSTQESEDRSLVDTRNAGDGTDAHSFGEQRNNLYSLAHFDGVTAKRSATGLRESGIAGTASVALNAKASVSSKLSCAFVLASEAGHVGFSLVFSAGKPDNQGLGFDCGLLPLLNLALLQAQTWSRAFYLFCPVVLEIVIAALRRVHRSRLARLNTSRAIVSSGTSDKHALLKGIGIQRNLGSILYRFDSAVNFRNPNIACLSIAQLYVNFLSIYQTTQHLVRINQNASSFRSLKPTFLKTITNFGREKRNTSIPQNLANGVGEIKHLVRRFSRDSSRNPSGVVNIPLALILRADLRSFNNAQKRLNLNVNQSSVGFEVLNCFLGFFEDEFVIHKRGYTQNVQPCQAQSYTIYG
jgi:hypothetical protein